MRTIWIFRHAAHEGPGYLLDVLEREGIAGDLIEIDRGHPVPAGLGEASGLVFLGGPMSVHDELPWIDPVLELIRHAVATDVPVLGICLGAQLLARALGAAVRPNPVPEIGWFPVNAADTARSKDWLGNLPDRFPVYHWHGETFDLPAGATHLLRSPSCHNQAFALGKHLGLQFHVEVTAPMVVDWSQRLELAPSPTVQSAAAMHIDLERKISALHGVADAICGRWLRRAFAIPSARPASTAARRPTQRARILH